VHVGEGHVIHSIEKIRPKMQARRPGRAFPPVPTDDTKASSRCKSMRHCPLPVEWVLSELIFEVQLSLFFAACALWMSRQVEVGDSTETRQSRCRFSNRHNPRSLSGRKTSSRGSLSCQLNRFDFLASGNDESVINPRCILGSRRVLRNLAAK